MILKKAILFFDASVKFFYKLPEKKFEVMLCIDTEYNVLNFIEKLNSIFDKDKEIKKFFANIEKMNYFYEARQKLDLE